MAESAALLAALDEKIAAAEETLRTLRDARTTLLRQIENDRLDAHLALLPAEVLTALDGFDSWTIEHVRREENAEADALVNQALDAGGTAP